MNASPHCKQSSGTHELWLSVVNRILGDSPRLLMFDVCCGACAVTRKLGFQYVTACDVIPRSDEFPPGWFFTQADALSFLADNDDQIADLVICSDGIEHLTRSDGEGLLRQMSRVGRIAIVFTPTGDSTFDPKALGPHCHKSSWTEKDFLELEWSSEHFTEWHPILGWGAMFAWKNRYELS